MLWYKSKNCIIMILQVHVPVRQRQGGARQEGKCWCAHLQDHPGEEEEEEENFCCTTVLLSNMNDQTILQAVIIATYSEPIIPETVKSIFKSRSIPIYNQILSVCQHNRKAGRVPDFCWLLGLPGIITRGDNQCFCDQL